METSRKGRGFIKGKLMPLYHGAKSSASSTVQNSNNAIKSSQSSPAAATVGYVVHQDYLIAQPKQNFSFIVPSAPHDNNVNRDHHQKLSHFETLFGDESVDIKAASYISSVQERFKLERLNSERIMKHQDSAQ